MSHLEATSLEAVDRRAAAGAIRRRRGALARGARHEAGVPDDELLRDLVDALAAAVELDSDDGFAHHVREAALAAEAHGIPRAQVDATLASLRRQLHDAYEVRAHRCIDAARLALEAARFAQAPSEPRAFRKERAAYLEAALAGHWATAVAIVDRVLAEGHAMLDVYADLVGEALYEVGRRWARGEIRVADQHIASSVSDYVLSRLYARSPVGESRSRSAIVACAPTEAHQTGAHIVADALDLDGWDVRFLGANVAANVLVEAVDESEASLVALSVALLPTAMQASRVIADLRARFLRDMPRVIVGGPVVRAVPGLWQAMGADAFAADVRGLTEVARGGSA